MKGRCVTNVEPTNVICNHDQRFELDANGTSRIRKMGCLVERATNNFDALKFKIDYNHMPANEKQQLMEKVQKELGRYPKWYKTAKDTTEKAGQPRATVQTIKE